MRTIDGVINPLLRLIARALWFDKQHGATILLLALSSPVFAAEGGKTLQGAMNISGVYADAAKIITPRRFAPRERVSFSGLRFSSAVTSKVGPIASVRITQRQDAIQFEFLDATGTVALTQLITKSQHSLEIGADHVTFRDFEKYQSPELGSVRAKNIFKITLDERRQLIVDLELNYTTTMLFVISVPGHDRGVYAFPSTAAFPSPLP